jgi:hypothetical protein
MESDVEEMFEDSCDNFDYLTDDPEIQLKRGLLDKVRSNDGRAALTPSLLKSVASETEEVRVQKSIGDQAACEFWQSNDERHYFRSTMGTRQQLPVTEEGRQRSSAADVDWQVPAVHRQQSSTLDEYRQQPAPYWQQPLSADEYRHNIGSNWQRHRRLGSPTTKKIQRWYNLAVRWQSMMKLWVCSRMCYQR